MRTSLPILLAVLLSLLAWNAQAQRVVPIGDGITGQSIRDMVEYQGKLVIVGGFQAFNGHACNNIVAWDGDQVFDMPGAFGGLYDIVYSLALYEEDMVVLGREDGVTRIARWNGSGWSTMGNVSGFDPYNGHLVTNAGQIYVSTSNMPVSHWDGSSWVQVGDALDGAVRAMAIYDGSLYAGGTFTATSDNTVQLDHLARWNGTAWESVLTGLNGTVNDMDSTSEGLAIVGNFTMDGDSVLNLPRWTVYDGLQFREGEIFPGSILLNVSEYPEGGFLLCGTGYAIWKRIGEPDAYIDLETINAVMDYDGRTIVAGLGGSTTSYHKINGIGEVIPGEYQEYLDINNIKAVIPTTPMTFWNQRQVGQNFFAPKEDGTQSIYFAKHWIIGKVAGVTHTSAPGQSSSPWAKEWAGPHALVMDDAFFRRYDQVWKLDKGMVANHIAHWADPNYQMPHAIATWPGNGNTANGEPARLAPFADLNGNGFYEPDQGEYPLIRGDQAVYTIQHTLQDMDSVHPAMDLDLHLMYYAFADSGNADTYNTVFENVQIINRGTQAYDSLRFAMFMDFDIGGYSDDFSGCDSLLNLYFAYNGDDFDDSTAGLPGYGTQPPAQGTLFLNQPLSAFSSTKPVLNTTFEDLMNGTMNTMPFSEAGYPSHFQFPGGNFTEDALGDQPGSRQGVGSIGPYSLTQGDTLCIDIAYPYANAVSGGRLASVTALKERAQALHDWYTAQDMGCSNYPQVFAGIAELDRGNMRLYPNPTSSSITLERAGRGEQAVVQIHAMSGRLVMQADWRASSTRIGMDVSTLPAGIYAVEVRTSDGVQVRRLVKQ